MAHSCKGCDNTWTGSRQAHCSGCHETFSTENNFDKHRVGHSFPLKCASPEVVEMVQNARGIWRAAGEEDLYERMRGGAE
jgi:transposase-like protein